jgi:hypothetical protein
VIVARGPAAGHPLNGEEDPRARHAGACPGLGTSSPRVIITADHLGWVRGKLVRVRVTVTEIRWNGNMRRRAPGTAGLTGARPLGQHHRAGPAPPYRAAAGSSVHVLHHRGQPDQIPVRSHRPGVRRSRHRPPTPGASGNTVILTADGVGRPARRPTTEQNDLSAHVKSASRLVTCKYSAIRRFGRKPARLRTVVNTGCRFSIRIRSSCRG